MPASLAVRARAQTVRFVPAEFCPLTMYLSSEDVAALGVAAQSRDIVQFVTQHVRHALLGQPVAGAATCRRSGLVPRVFHLPGDVVDRIEAGKPPGELAALIAELLDSHLKGGAL
jgi:hypothetical protein